VVASNYKLLFARSGSALWQLRRQVAAQHAEQPAAIELTAEGRGGAQTVAVLLVV